MAVVTFLRRPEQIRKAVLEITLHLVKNMHDFTASLFV